MENESDAVSVSRRLDVALRLAGGDEAVPCQTYEIGMGSLFLDGAVGLSSGQHVDVIFPAANGGPLTLPCCVEASAGRHLFLRYEALNGEQRQCLEQIIWPPWDGSDLLDGLMLLSARYGATSSLTEWLRLTSLLSVWQPRRLNRQHLS